MKNLFIISLLLLTGCAALPQKPCPVPPVAPVAVVTAPTQTTIAPPIALPISQLKASDSKDYQKIANAYAQSVTILEGELKAAIIKLQGYQTPKPPQEKK